MARSLVAAGCSRLPRTLRRLSTRAGRGAAVYTLDRHVWSGQVAAPSGPAAFSIVLDRSTDALSGALCCGTGPTTFRPTHALSASERPPRVLAERAVPDPHLVFCRQICHTTRRRRAALDPVPWAIPTTCGEEPALRLRGSRRRRWRDIAIFELRYAISLARQPPSATDLGFRGHHQGHPLRENFLRGLTPKVKPADCARGRKLHSLQLP